MFLSPGSTFMLHGGANGPQGNGAQSRDPGAYYTSNWQSTVPIPFFPQLRKSKNNRLERQQAF